MKNILSAAGIFSPARLATDLRVAGLLVLVGLAACTTPTKAIDSAGNSSGSKTSDPSKTSEEGVETAETKSDEAKPEIIRQKSTVARKGTNIRAIVNGEPITNFDVQRRVAFLKLRRVGGNRSQKALDELAEEKIKMQEAKRRRVVAKDSEVNKSFASFAKSNRMSSSQMSTVLNRAGVTADHFKEFIRVQMSWNRAVGSKFRADTTSKSTEQTMAALRDAGGQKPETTEYFMEQIIFVIPESRRKAILKQRRTEAEAFRKRFTACGETAKLAVGIRDVTVRTLPRSLEPQLPPLWKEALIETPQGGTTGIKDTEKGVEFLAVCSKRTVSDDNAARIVAREKDFESFNEKGDEVSRAFLAELKSKSKIIYR